MKSLFEYQQIFNDNLLGGISYYLMNNPVISWDSGFIQGLTGLCFLIAIMDAFSSIDNGKEFARKILTTALCLVVVLANFGKIDSRSIINFNLSPKYDYMKSAPDVSKTLMAKLNMKNLPSSPVATLDRDVFNAMRQFFDGVSSSLRSAMDVTVNGGSSTIPIPQTLQTFAYTETMYLLDQARTARSECNVGTSADYIKCLSDKVPFDITAEDKTKACSGGDCESTTANEEKEEEGTGWTDMLLAMARAILGLITFLQLVVADFIFIVFFPICFWLLDALRSVVSLFLIIGYGLGTAGMYLFAKLISPMLLLPKERSSVLNAYRTLYALTLFGFVTDIFTFFTSLLMMGLHYATFQVFKQLFTDAANSGGSSANQLIFNMTFNELLMVVYFTVVVILVINIIALGKIKETCLTLANFSFSKLVSLGGELVSSGISMTAKIAAIVAGGAVAGGVMATKFGGGAAMGALKSTEKGQAMLSKASALKGAAGNFMKNNKLSKGVSGAWKGSSAEKIFANAKLGGQQSLYGDQGQKEMFTRNFGDSVLKTPEADSKKAKDAENKNKKDLATEGGSGESKSAAPSTSGSNSSNSGSNLESKKTSTSALSESNAKGASSGTPNDNFDATTSGTSSQSSSGKAEGSGQGGSSKGGDKARSTSSNKLTSPAKSFSDRAKKYQNMFDKVGNLVSSGAKGGSVNIADSIPGALQSGIHGGFDKMAKSHDEKLQKIFNNEELLEEERRKLDLTDSSVKMAEAQNLSSSIANTEYESNKEAINAMEAKIGTADIYQDGKLREDKISDDMINDVMKMQGHYSSETINGMSEEARKNMEEIANSKKFKSMQAQRNKELNRLAKKAASNSSQGNMEALSNFIASNNLGKNDLESLGATGLGKSLSETVKSSGEQTLEKIAKDINSKDPKAVEEANMRKNLIMNSQDLQSEQNMFVGESNKKARDLAVKAGIFDDKVASSMATAETFNKLRNDNKELVKAFAKGQKEGELPNGIKFKLEEDYVTGSVQVKIQNGDEALLEDENGRVNVNAIQDYNTRAKLTKMKNDLDRIFATENVEAILSPSEIDNLRQLKDKFIV